MWAYSSVLYQIYPLGFCGAPHANDGQYRPRIKKLADWAPYLQELGVGAVLLNPVFESDNHGYDTRDLRRVDCRLGSNADFAAVCRRLHGCGLRVILDGVFNHVGRGFWAFLDLQKNRQASAYKDWFFVDFGRDSNYGDGFWYEGWEGHFELVKLNLRNPAVVDYLLGCVRFWAEEFRIDGLRLDVAYSLDRDFMRALRRQAEAIGPDFLLIGEVLFGDYNQIVNPEMLHSCTNYECYKGLWSSFNSMNLFEIAHSLHRQYGPDPWCLYRGQHLVCFADNHDVTRLASILTDPGHLRPALGLLFGMPGIPCLYYGSEWGQTGSKEPGNDYALRPCFEAPCPNGLTAFVRQLIALRRSSEALCSGGYRNLIITNRQLVFERACARQRVLVAVNAEPGPCTLENPALQGAAAELLTGQTLQLNGRLELPGYGVQFLQL